MSAEKIITDWKKKIYKPVYWLEGEEPYFIDKIVHYAENNILTSGEASFNLTVFYGRDADWTNVVNACMRYPMFSEKQVVLLKEAQHMKEIEKLENYIEKPLASTVFIISYKDKKLDGRSKIIKSVKQKHEYLNSEKIKEYKLSEWVMQMIHEQGLIINQMALTLLIDHIGNDLSRLENEVEKLSLNLKERKSITENDIENFVGISKEYNIFEMQDALSRKDLPKAIRIIQYFQANPKAAPIHFLLPALYNYFSKVYTIFDMPDKSEKAIAAIFYNNYFAARQALHTYKLYGFTGIEKVLLLLHQYNLKSIGVNDTGTNDAELMKELTVKVMEMA